MSTIVRSTTIQKPIVEVFDYATTIANWGVMHPAMARYLVTPPDHPKRVGESFVEHTPMKMDLVWTVKECTRPMRWMAEAPVGKKSAVGMFTFSYQLAEMDNGTRFEMSLSFTPRSFLGKLMDLLMFAGADRKDVEMAIIHLKQVMETGKSMHH